MTLQKVALITGCSAGIGKAAALAFLEAGWKVAATMRNIDDWGDTPGSDDLLVLAMDVRDSVSIGSTLRDVASHFGRVDYIVNNAGIALFAPFEQSPMSTIRDLFETNFFGPMQVVQAALPYLRQSSFGVVVNVSSQSAIMPEPLMAVYSAMKCALEGFTESLRYELAEQGISLKIVEPGMIFGTNLIETTLKLAQQIPVPALYQPFVSRILKMYTERAPEGLASAADVAATTVLAAEDQSPTLRFQIGPDAILTAQMRRGTSENQYERYAQKAFGLLQSED